SYQSTAQAIEGGTLMSEEQFELVQGSGNVYRDFGDVDADVRQAKALLAAEIIKLLEKEDLSTRDAQVRTGINHSEFVQIRRANLGRFTIDRLISILGRLNQQVEITITTHPRTTDSSPMAS
ncbi:MAG: helix-turn-helix domain-containing protein, partial [Microcystis panniformis]